MAKEIRCADVGLYPDCEGVLHGETDEEVMAAAVQHGREVHDLREEDLTPEVTDRVAAAIRSI
jgi:predicted small metal-binding protein